MMYAVKDFKPKFGQSNFYRNVCNNVNRIHETTNEGGDTGAGCTNVGFKITIARNPPL